MAVTDLLVGGLCVSLSTAVGLLVSYQILSDHYICVLHGLCCDIVRCHSHDLFDFPSDNDGMGKVRGHWKAD